MRFATKELRAEYCGHKIIVTNSWGGGVFEALVREGLDAARKAISDETSLSIDGKIVGVSNGYILFSSRPILSAVIGESGPKLEVFGKAGWLSNKIKLCINGERIAGDDF